MKKKHFRVDDIEMFAEPLGVWWREMFLIADVVLVNNLHTTSA